MNSSDARAADELIPRLYNELRTLARAQLRRERPGHTVSTTGLVHEAYLRLAGQVALEPRDRTQFFAIAAATMRRVLVDYARSRKRAKRGGGADVVPLDEVADFITDHEAEQLIALNDALEQLEQFNPRAFAVVQHRYFGGFTLEETAELLDVSLKTVQRDWLVATAWLRKEITGAMDEHGH